MIDPIGQLTPEHPVAGSCPKCGNLHDPTKCKAHSRRNDGNQCLLPPMLGQQVCNMHGGRSPRAKAAGLGVVAENRLRQELGRLTVTPVANPLQELQNLAGEAQAWKELLAGHVARLSHLRYSTDGGEAIRGEIQLFERAMDRCLAVLATIAKLNIDERLVRIQEEQKNMILRAIDMALSSAGVNGTAAAQAKQVAARHLRSVA
jgi:hypothetical protein